MGCLKKNKTSAPIEAWKCNLSYFFIMTDRPTDQFTDRPTDMRGHREVTLPTSTGPFNCKSWNPNYSMSYETSCPSVGQSVELIIL